MHKQISVLGVISALSRAQTARARPRTRPEHGHGAARHGQSPGGTGVGPGCPPLLERCASNSHKGLLGLRGLYGVADPDTARTGGSKALASLLQTATPSCRPADLDLDGLKRKLDAQGMALAQAQEASLKSRKQLAENTKGMRACRGGREPCDG